MNIHEATTAFHNDPTVKRKYIDRVKAHQKADNLVQDYGYWRDGKGCAVGCTLEVDENVHEFYPEKLGLPVWLAHLEDHIFEQLPKDKAKNWPLEFLEAIPVGKQITPAIRDHFQIWWLDENLKEVDAASFAEVVKATDAVKTLVRQAINGEEPDAAVWAAARSAAWAAARSAAEAAAEAAADAAVWAAARSAAWAAARSAAEAAARSAAEAAAEAAAWSAAEAAAWATAEAAAEAAAEATARSAAERKAEYLLNLLKA